MSLSPTCSPDFRQLFDVEMLPFCAGCRIFETGLGRIVIHPALSFLYDSNLVLLRRYRPGISLQEMEELVRPAFTAAGATHLRFLAESELADPIMQEFLNAGYQHARYWIMEAKRPPTREPSTRTVVYPVEDYLGEAVLNTIEAELLEEFPWDSAVFRAALRARRKEVSSHLNLMWYLAEQDGIPAGSVGLLRSGPTASIQAVSTRPAFRGKSVATSMVLNMLERARQLGHDRVCLMTEADDWPQKLYEQMGFDRVGAVESFLKDE